ncbi:alpha/beta fold hydrolase [Actinoplanes friuliensis]|uniref:Alpha/beta hydrolase n=1 Tax=Actinoplanes friuliensis DSM 7358 TaxID=1246995 RepID=U5VYW8_9ACTN|nr:alpha/beta hydrolase [Actinoplanes friuliensis]AGZ40871.1 alpha/beta hydrolase [Actinoplanes friuliensis DSM 7358]
MVSRTSGVSRSSTSTATPRDSDPLVHPLRGRATAEAIPGATLVMVPGMGHDLPEGAWPTIADAIVANAARV